MKMQHASASAYSICHLVPLCIWNKEADDLQEGIEDDAASVRKEDEE
jgi:hypothetical protein